jgi:uncharacterized protein YcfJ
MPPRHPGALESTMKRLSATLLALGLVAAVGTASAQSYGNYGNDPYYRNAGNTNVYPDRYGNSGNAIYDYARVLRVDPVIDSRYGSNNVAYGSNGQRCYTSTTPGRYENDGYYGNNGYRNDGYNDRYGNDPYYPQQGQYGTNTGRTVATVIGGIAGAVLGSKVGGGSGQVAATAIGSMVGGLAGRQVYEAQQRRKYTPAGQVTVCDPVPVNSYGSNTYARNGYGNNAYNGSGYVNDGRVTAYDVTYEYAGRQFVTRTNYHPGDRIRVRVDVRPE